MWCGVTCIHACIWLNAYTGVHVHVYLYMMMYSKGCNQRCKHITRAAPRFWKWWVQSRLRNCIYHVFYETYERGGGVNRKVLSYIVVLPWLHTCTLYHFYHLVPTTFAKVVGRAYGGCNLRFVPVTVFWVMWKCTHHFVWWILYYIYTSVYKVSCINKEVYVYKRCIKGYDKGKA